MYEAGGLSWLYCHTDLCQRASKGHCPLVFCGSVVGIPSEIISLKKVTELHPLLNVHDLVGALHVPEDAVVSSADVTLALASAASQHGKQAWGEEGSRCLGECLTVGGSTPSHPFLHWLFLLYILGVDVFPREHVLLIKVLRNCFQYLPGFSLSDVRGSFPPLCLGSSKLERSVAIYPQRGSCPGFGRTEGKPQQWPWCCDFELIHEVVQLRFKVSYLNFSPLPLL